MRISPCLDPLHAIARASLDELRSLQLARLKTSLRHLRRGAPWLYGYSDVGKPDGEEGELVFTSLTKEAMPVIRYRTRDLTSLLPVPDRRAALGDRGF